jgi:hypothetical protein
MEIGFRRDADKLTAIQICLEYLCHPETALLDHVVVSEAVVVVVVVIEKKQKKRRLRQRLRQRQ